MVERLTFNMRKVHPKKWRDAEEMNIAQVGFIETCEFSNQHDDLIILCKFSFNFYQSST